MKVPLRWLEEFIDLPTRDVAELSYALDMLGLTVEGVETLDVGWDGVYVGEVVAIASHPDADKIRVCQVDSGQGAEQVICGAWNFEAGARVAVARPGARLPGGVEIGSREIRGVVSHGMICSEAELHLGADHAGILVLDGDPEPGTDLADIIELPDLVFDLDVTPNRPDALSIRGVARDLAAYFGVEHRVPTIDLETVDGETAVSVEIADPSGCRRFTAREIAGVAVGPSPLWLRHRLSKVGVRPISNVVDVTNYVMFELGHPLHAFDADTIEGDRLVVRRATRGETLVTLDGEERELHPEDLVIYDDEGPTSMSGTMGGERSEVSAATSRVLMEAASWDPPTIMRMWRRHDLRSEAATRFERGVDPNLADEANQRASALVAQLTGGSVLQGAVDEVAVRIDSVEVTLTVRDVERLLGPGFDGDRISEILQRLGMGVTGDDPMMVTVPTFRPDVTRAADLVEEVARIHGYDKFESTLPTGPAGGLSVGQRRLREVHGVLVGLGLSQAINLPFVGLEDAHAVGQDSSDLLTVKNPLRDEESKLRPSLLPGLLGALRYNRSHGNDSVALFESGKVFSAGPSPQDPRLPHQVDRLAWAIVGPLGPMTLRGASVEADAHVSLAIWRHLAESLGLEAVTGAGAAPAFHPARTAEVRLDGISIGHVGELAPLTARQFDLDGRVAIAEIDLDPLLEPVAPPLFRAPSPFPHVEFDLSFVVGRDVTAAELSQITAMAGDGLVETSRVFDQFEDGSLGSGKRALAIRYRLRAPDRTLQADEISSIRDSMIAAAAERGASLRGAP